MPRSCLVLSAAATLVAVGAAAPRPVSDYAPQGKLWDVDTLASGQVLFDLGPVRDQDPGYFGTLPAIDFSPDGTRVATAGGRQTARVWDAVTGKAVFDFAAAGDLGPVQAVRFRADGTLLAADREAVWQFDVAGKRAKKLFAHRCRKVVLSPDGSLCAGDELGWPDSQKFGFVSVVYAAATGAEVVRLKTDNNRYLKFSPDGSRLLSVSFAYDGPFTVRVWDVKSGKRVASRHGSDPTAWHPAGNLLAMKGAKEDVIELWDPTTGKVTPLRHGHAELTALAFSPDGKRLVSAGLRKPAAGSGRPESELKVWDMSAGKELLTALAGSVRIDAVAVSPDGRRLATTGVSETEAARK